MYSKNSLSLLFCRINYTFNNKYLITASNRWDGASVLAEGKNGKIFLRWLWRGKVGQESFLKDSKTVSDRIESQYRIYRRNNVFRTQPNNCWTTKPLCQCFLIWLQDGNLLIWPTKLWHGKKTRELNFGLDFGFLSNRITGSVDVYDRLSDKLIYQQQLPLETGWGRTYANVGSVSNKGVEVLLTTKNIQTEKVNWKPLSLLLKTLTN